MAWACKNLIQTKSDWGPLGEKSDMTKLKEETLHYTLRCTLYRKRSKTITTDKILNSYNCGRWIQHGTGKLAVCVLIQQIILRIPSWTKGWTSWTWTMLIEKYCWKIAGIQSRVHLELRMKHIWFVIGGAWWVASPMWWPQSKVETLGWPLILGYCLSMFSINSINHSTIQHSWGI